LDELSLDVELWSKINHLVADERWAELGSQSVIFFEHWIRTHSKLPKELVGKDLMTAAFKDGGPLALGAGCPPAEGEGWHLIALGLTRAVRNPAGHRIDDGARS
jgi:hypothetical protein